MSQLRIIAGEWRGRRLPVPRQTGLRPTPDRVRESLFNWLQMHTPGAHCLDLFAGSGALGIEAASRGAAQVTLVEHSAPVCRQLRANIDTLAAGQIEIVHGDGLRWLRRDELKVHGGWDLVFLDPPYHKGLLGAAIQALNDTRSLRQGAMIYLEHGADETLPALPDGWQLLKSKRAGDVHYNLCSVTTP